MLRKVLAATVVAGAVGFVAAPAMADPSVCYDVSASVTVNDTSQSAAQAGCLPG